MKHLTKQQLCGMLAFLPVCAYGANLTDIDSGSLNTIGTGDNEYVIMLSFGSERCIDNITFKWLSDKETDFSDPAGFLEQLAQTDQRFNFDNGRLILDLNSDKAFSEENDLSAEGWTLFDEGDTDGVKCVKLQSSNATQDNPVFYLPSIDTQGVWLPSKMSGPLQDEKAVVRAYVQFDGQFSACSWRASKVNTKYQSDTSKATLTNRSDDKYSANILYKTQLGTTYIQFRPSYKNEANKTAYLESNFCEYTVEAPERPVTSLYWESDEMDIGLQKNISDKIHYEPEDATYTKITFASDNTKVVTNSMLSTLEPGEANITATYAYVAEGENPLSAAAKVTTSLQVPIESVTFDFLEESGDSEIVMAPRRIRLLSPKIYPDNADIQRLSFEINNPDVSDKSTWKAALYQVNMWNEDGSRYTPYELISYRPGATTLKIKALSPDPFEMEIPIIINDFTPDLTDYTDGTLLMNEEWFGHMSGGMNYATPEHEIVYQVYANENEGGSFGCTSQFGMIWNDKLFVSSKQAVDGGDPTGGGGRLVIADARTLKRISSLDDLMFGDETKSSDGRALAGAAPNKIYHGTAGQIYIVEMDDDGTNPRITGKVAYNEESTGSGNNTEGQGSLYNGQIGDMVNAGRHVFGITQDKGVFIIDTGSDEVVKTIEDKNVQGICQVANGTVWYATKTEDKKQSVFVGLDPKTFEEHARVTVPEEFGIVNCGWGAWRTTQFTGSKTLNTIFFAGGASVSNGGSGNYCRYDIDSNRFSGVFDLGGLKGHNEYLQQGAYGSIRYDDRTNQLIVGTTEFKASGHYRYNWLYWVNADNGEIEHCVELEPYYWFFSHAIFPDKETAQLKDKENMIEVVYDKDKEIQESVTVDLLDYVTDPDNIDSNILFSEPAADALSEATDADFLLEGTHLTVTPKKSGETNYLLNTVSNGKEAVVSIPVKIGLPSGVADIDDIAKSVRVDGKRVHINGYADKTFTLCAADGTLIDSFTVDNDRFTCQMNLAPGVYVIASEGISVKILVK